MLLLMAATTLAMQAEAGQVMERGSGCVVTLGFSGNEVAPDDAGMPR